MVDFINILRRRKTIMSFENEERENGFKKSLNFYDLVFLGVGSTLGVGIYILSGQVAKEDAGPAIIFSFFIAAFISTLAGLCFAEFGAFAPTSGSIYTYCYVTLGEFTAFIMGWNLITQYIIGTASVVKALSVYLDAFTNQTIENELRKIYEIDVPYFSQYFDLFAFAICIVFALALSFGMKESVMLNNVLTSLNVGLVIFFVVVGMTKVNFNLWSIPKYLVPSNAGEGGFFPYGWSGVIKGTAPCFYGFIGFECIATTGSEVLNPQKTLPLAIITSLFIIFLAYFGISTVLTLMVPYFELNIAAPLAFALSFVGYDWAKWTINVGSLFGLVAALFGAFFPISRIMYAMANDGLLYQLFNKISVRYNTPVAGTMFTGVITGFTAAVLDVDHLINLNSIGTLLSFTVIAACVIILRYAIDIRQDDDESTPLKSTDSILENGKSMGKKSVMIYKYTNNFVTSCISIFCVLSVLLSFILTYEISNAFVMIFIIIGMIAILVAIKLQRSNESSLPFKVPFVPFVPALSIFLNILFMVQFDYYTWARLVFWLLIGFSVYFSYGIFNSKERNQKKFEI